MVTIMSEQRLTYEKSFSGFVMAVTLPAVIKVKLIEGSRFITCLLMQHYSQA